MDPYWEPFGALWATIPPPADTFGLPLGASRADLDLFGTILVSITVSTAFLVHPGASMMARSGTGGSPLAIWKKYSF